MSNKQAVSFHTVPVEIAYLILDNLDPLEIIQSVQDVCTRLNVVIASYHRYKVEFISMRDSSNISISYRSSIHSI